jgi:hypothetical protein
MRQTILTHETAYRDRDGRRQAAGDLADVEAIPKAAE